MGVDQFGREQAAGPAPRNGSGTWEHRIIGLCSTAPGIIPRHGIVCRGGKSGTYKIYLDNLRLRHADGSLTPIWTGHTDTRTAVIEDSASFQNVRIRSVPLSQVALSR